MVLCAPSALAQVAVTVTSNEDDASQRAIASAVVTSAQGRWEMLKPLLPASAVKTCKTGDTACLRSVAGAAKATHLLIVGVAPLGSRDHVVAVQLFDVSLVSPLFEDSVVQPGGPGELRQVKTLTSRLIEVAGPRQNLTYAVTPLDGLGVDAALLAKLDASLVQRVNDLKLPTIDANAVRGNASCAGDPACLKQLGEKVGADRVLAGSVGLAGDQLHIALKLVDVARGKESRAVEEAVPFDQADLRLRASATKLLAPDQYNKSGSLYVVMPLTGAEVLIDGRVRGTSPLAGPIDSLPPGRREVEVRYAGAKPWRSFVDLRFEEPHRIELDLVDGALIEVPPRAEAIAEPVVEEVNVLLLSGIATLGVGVATGVGAIVAYNANEEAAGRLTDGKINAKNFDDHHTVFIVGGALTAATVTALAIGSGLIGLSMVE